MRTEGNPLRKHAIIEALGFVPAPAHADILLVLDSGSSMRDPEKDLGMVLGGKYQLRRVLGSGASGAVFEGRDGATRQRVAVKVLHKNLLEHDEHVARFIREMKIAARIVHEGVVRFLDAGRAEDGRPYMVQEFLHGENMQEVMDRGGLTLPDTFQIVLQLLDALSAVHGQKLVHRDIKPENVFLFYGEYGDLKAKLVDFGIVKPPKKDEGQSEQTELTAVGATVGTPYYMSPEQACGDPVDGRADVWSVGVVLFEALTGSLPFYSEAPLHVLTKIVTEQAPSVSRYRKDLPPWLATVVDRALRTTPSARWQTANEMADALRAGTGMR